MHVFIVQTCVKETIRLQKVGILFDIAGTGQQTCIIATLQIKKSYFN